MNWVTQLEMFAFGDLAQESMLLVSMYMSPQRKRCYNTPSPSRTTVQSCYISARSFQVASNAAGWRRAANAMQSQGLEPDCSSDSVWIMTLVSGALESACKLFYMKCTICLFEWGWCSNSLLWVESTKNCIHKLLSFEKHMSFIGIFSVCTYGAHHIER